MFTLKSFSYLVLFATAVTANPTLPTVSTSIRQAYYEGDRISLECSVTGGGGPPPNITWTRENGQPPSTARQSDNYFIIENAKQEYSGDYRCTASNSAGKAFSVTTVTVVPRTPKKLIAAPSAPTVLEGQNTYIACNGIDVPSSSIKWIRRDGTPLSSNIHASNALLFINEARIADEGVYTCQTTTGEVEVSVLLTVSSLTNPANRTNIEVNVDYLKITGGQNGAVECFPTGRPLPQIVWSKAEGNFTPGTSQKGNKLVITNAQDSDGGLYKCTGTVDGVAITSINVPVEVQTHIPPKIKTTPQEELATVTGEKVELRCEALEGFPSPVLEWSRSNGELPSNTRITSAGVLRITSITTEDAGVYTCKATNEAGNDTSSVTVKVSYQLRLSITPGHEVTFTSDDSDEDELLNEREVKCIASGCPEPVSIKSKMGEIRIQSDRTSEAKCSIASLLPIGEKAPWDLCFGTCRDQATHELFTVGEKKILPDPFGPRKMLITEGEDVTFRCYGSGEYGSDQVETKIAKLEPNGEAFWERPNGAERTIHNATKADSGTYACYYSYHSIPTQSETFKLDVMRAPRITIAPETLTVLRRHSATVECNVEDDSIIDVAWDITEKANRHVQTNGTKLIFNHIRAKDAGNYTCYARNKLGLSSAVAQVTVIRAYTTDSPARGVLKEADTYMYLN